MHQLHCLKRVHHSYWPDRYYPNITEVEENNLQEYNLHCLQMLMNVVMCKADADPETLRWVEESKFPLGNRTSPHECVNWDTLREGTKRSRVDPFAPGVLVHPKFGPVVPDGRETIIGDENRQRFVINGTTVFIPENENNGR
ncbi:uncharacterized protein BDZ99DRAFT_164503 [Mytilinidion resinicola]|uniref:Uncharacterized protein n=1 Tax=Mytilinidion resinicola TaxID=574789 RepID=A0A6A6Y4X6_9PEZI|nr:uncharacterized protein BDZ99DRAFT_164503 [Mytilinidion resinicola]KAF2803866.1 hypothetical protein BDZ99DRAFT_164503 [Mytilinidion resinicola]